MSVLCGWASIDERGRASGGMAGDQTGREVKTGNWYDFGQTVVLRPNDREKGKQMASVMRKICNNAKVGYDQSQRTTLYVEMARVGWNPDKIAKNVETDCSALIAVVCKACGYNVSPDVWTGNMRNSLVATKKFKALTGSAYTETDKNLRAGDVILNPSRHVIMALEDGENLKVASTAKKYSGTFPVLPAKGYFKYGDVGTQVKRIQQFLNWYGGYGLAIDGSFGPATKTAVKAFQKSTGLVSDGFFGPKTLAKAKAVKK